MKRPTPPPLPLDQAFAALHRAWGPQGWWPARSSLEMMVGAILTQNTAWTNVERAIARLRQERALSLAALRRTPEAQLAEWIRPSGYFNQKALRLKALVGLVDDAYGGSLRRLLQDDPDRLRVRLLAVNGIGPETADSILLYAAHAPYFVVDAYTRRFLVRHGALGAKASYDEVAALFTRALPASAALYNEFHALIVRLGKEHCHARTPRCAGCPLEPFLPAGGAVSS